MGIKEAIEIMGRATELAQRWVDGENNNPDLLYSSAKLALEASHMIRMDVHPADSVVIDKMEAEYIRLEREGMREF